MSTYICFKCNHQWYKRSGTPPRRCPNHSCRTVMWGRPEDPPEKKSVEALPIVVIEPPKETKAAVFAELQAMMTAVKEKPKSDYYTKPIVPTYPVADQPDYYDSERSVKYD